MEKAVILVMLRPPAPCEEASNLETCTITAPDVITAFAVPNPNCSSQSQSVFFGSGRPTGCPIERITQPTSDWLMLFEPTLSIVDGAQHKCFVGASVDFCWISRRRC